MKKKKRFGLCRGFVGYVILVFCCVIFTQSLISEVSAFAMAFVLAVPAADLICLFFECRHISVETDRSELILSKYCREMIPLTVKNSGIVPISSVKMRISVPNKDNSGSETESQSIGVPPYTSLKSGINVCFPYRGIYRIGVDEICIYDLFGLFRMTVPVEADTTVTVLPELLPSFDVRPPVNEDDIGGDTFSAAGRNEYGDIRQYMPGDSIKSIHWKLSTKTEELQARRLVTDIDRTVTVYCDFGSRPEVFAFPDSAGIAADDSIASESYTAARCFAASGYSGRVIYRDIDGNITVNFFSDTDTADLVAVKLSSVDLSGVEPSLPADPISDGSGGVVFITAYCGKYSENIIRSAASECGISRIIICLCDLSYMLTGEDCAAYRKELELLCSRLTASGIRSEILSYKPDARHRSVAEVPDSE